MENVQHLWNKRASLLKDSYSSVMEQAFPRIINEAIHRIHLSEISSVLLNETNRCLDIGCGWGRIASALIKSHPYISITGIDLAENFVKLFNWRLKGKGKAVIGDMQKLPFRSQTFDVVYCVVSFMYLSTESKRRKAILEMLRVLKKEGTLVLIEPNKMGVDLVRLWGLVPYFYRLFTGKVKVETYGTAFYPAEIQSLVNSSGGIIVRKRGYPLFSIMLLFLIVIGKFIPSLASVLISASKIVDRLMPISTFSYFNSWIIQRSDK